MAPFLTVLTTPMPTAGRRVYQDLRRRLRPLVKPGVPLPEISPYPGHYALVRSVVEGLGAIGADFNFNPRRLRDLGRAVYAPANEALRQAAGWKRRGWIEYLAAGPVNALFTDEGGGVLLLPEIDRVIVASEWVKDLYRDAPALVMKCRSCPCGVDPELWKPATPRRPAEVALVYWKSGDEDFCGRVEQVVRACGLEPRRVRSGAGEHSHYTRDDYRRLLEEARVAVFLSAFETQGLALAEAWSMDVPTMVWDPKSQATWNGRTFQAGSSAPYLTAATGRPWQTIEELEIVLRGALDEPSAFRPRAWVLGNMTDAIRAAALYDLICDGWTESRSGR